MNYFDVFSNLILSTKGGIHIVASETGGGKTMALHYICDCLASYNYKHNDKKILFIFCEERNYFNCKILESFWDIHNKDERSNLNRIEKIRLRIDVINEGLAAFNRYVKPKRIGFIRDVIDVVCLKDLNKESLFKIFENALNLGYSDIVSDVPFRSLHYEEDAMIGGITNLTRRVHEILMKNKVNLFTSEQLLRRSNRDENNDVMSLLPLQMGYSANMVLRSFVNNSQLEIDVIKSRKVFNQRIILPFNLKARYGEVV